MLDPIGQASAIGTPEQAQQAVAAFLDRTQADELIVAGATYDPSVRVRSLELAANAAENR